MFKSGANMPKSLMEKCRRDTLKMYSRFEAEDTAQAVAAAKKQKERARSKRVAAPACPVTTTPARVGLEEKRAQREQEARSHNTRVEYKMYPPQLNSDAPMSLPGSQVRYKTGVQPNQAQKKGCKGERIQKAKAETRLVRTGRFVRLKRT